jgi:hypothetical protein
MPQRRFGDEQAEMAVVLDAGALIALDRRDRRVGTLLRRAQQDQQPVRTSAAVLGQVWRDGARQVQLARALPGIDVVELDEFAAQRAGELLKRGKTADVVDAHLASLVAGGDVLLTSDRDDLQSLLDTRRVVAVLFEV